MRSRMLPPDVWDRLGRSEATWTEVAWRRRITWMTGQDFGLQSACRFLHPVHQWGHLVGDMTQEHTCQTLKFYSIKIKKAKNTRKDGISAIYRKVFWTFSGNSYSTALSSSVPSEWIWCGRGTSPNFCKAYLGMGSDSDLRLGDGFWSHITKSHDTVIFLQ